MTVGAAASAPAGRPGAGLARTRRWRAALVLTVLGAVAAPPVAPQNVLLVLLDDAGVDKIGAYGESPHAGPTPVIDALASEGVAFRNAAAMPLCSPTRVSTLTGRLPGRTGVGVGMKWSGTNGSFTPDPRASVSLPELLRRRGWATACVGKWHMSLASEPEPFLVPLHWGFDAHLGVIANMSYDGGGYLAWTQNTALGGVAFQEPATGYLTTRQVDDALAVIDAFGETPWFVWLALSAPHEPLDDPPSGLHTQGDLTGADYPTRYRAVLEAADTELGRLLDGLAPDVMERTWVIVMGDNGTYATAMEAPFGIPANHAKDNVFEGGVNVPLIVRGPGVQAGWSDALVSCTDLYATIAELLGVALPPGSAEDSLSFAANLADPAAPGRRRVQVTQKFEPNGFGPYDEKQGSARDGRYKFLKAPSPSGLVLEQFYDLLEDPFEQDNLIDLLDPPLTGAAKSAHKALKAALAAAP